jgi:hypothetical protein
VWEAEPTRSKLKGKGKTNVDDKLVDEVWSEEMAILKAKRAAIQAMIDRLGGWVFIVVVLHLFSCFFVPALYYVFLCQYTVNVVDSCFVT